jgi:hypothetical protein
LDGSCLCLLVPQEYLNLLSWLEDYACPVFPWLQCIFSVFQICNVLVSDVCI